jgi:mono/diheme cytochrome c family protein
VVVVLVVLSLLPLAYIGVLRVTPSKEPRVSIVPDMDSQQKFKAQSYNPMFADGRGMRYYPVGTVARGEERQDGHLYQGIVNGQWATSFPMPVSEALMARGQRQYNIYCTPCHGYSGYGDGMVAKRAEELALVPTPGMSWVPPKSLQDPDTLARPAGHIFNTISRGIRSMPSYSGQISVEDRWAIVFYVRALQRSQHSSLKEVPADQLQALLSGQAQAIQAQQDAAKAAEVAKAAEAAKAAADAKKPAASATPRATPPAQPGSAASGAASGDNPAGSAAAPQQEAGK